MTYTVALNHKETDVPEWGEQLENDRGTAVPWEASVFY